LEQLKAAQDVVFADALGLRLGAALYWDAVVPVMQAWAGKAQELEERDADTSVGRLEHIMASSARAFGKALIPMA
jgi:hypothetical protein